MSRFRLSLIPLAAVVLTAASGVSADPPPLADLIKELSSNPDRMKQEAAAKTILEHYKSQSLQALPAVMESLGHELNRYPRNPKGRACNLTRVLPELAAGIGAERVKPAFEATKHKDEFVRAGAFRLLFHAAEDKKAGVNRADLLVAIRRGVKDDSQLVRAVAVQACIAFRGGESKMTDQVIPLLITALDDDRAMENHLNCPAYTAACAVQYLGAAASSALPALNKTASTTENLIVIEGCFRAIGRLAKEDPAIADAAREAFRKCFADPKRSSEHRCCAVLGLIPAGSAAGKVLPALVAVLDESGLEDLLRARIYNTLQSLGAHSATVVTPLIRRLNKTTDRGEQEDIVRTFLEIGPAALEAKDAIRDWADAVKKNDERHALALRTLEVVTK